MAESNEVTSSSAAMAEEIRHNFNTDWRAENPNFNDQMAYFCMRDEMADIEFVFDRCDKITVCSFVFILFCYVCRSKPQQN